RDVSDPVVPMAEWVDGQALTGGGVGHRQGFDRQDEDVPVPDVVALYVCPQRQWRGVLAAVEEDGGARHAVQRWFHRVDLVYERLQRSLVLLAQPGDQFPAALPGCQDREHRDSDE